jgi:hypothetical protein
MNYHALAVTARKKQEAEYYRNLSPDAGHWASALFMQTVTTKQLRALLLNEHDTVIRAGCLCDLKKKYLGVGVYKIWYVPKVY